MGNWLDESIHKKNQSYNRAIVFIHGLNGSRLTWKGGANRFLETLKSDNAICDDFGLYIFEYPTKIFSANRVNKILSFVPGLKKRDFNVSIRRIALELKSYLCEILIKFETIVLISHSMGGLVSKVALVEMDETQRSRIKLWISLSVPHNGSGIAKIGTDLLGNNPQLMGLRIFSEFTSDLTNRFSQLNNKPQTVYQTGNHDLIVPEGSAIPAGVLAEDRLDTGDNHYSVLQINDPISHLPYQRIKREIIAILDLEAQQGLFSKPNSAVKFVIPENCPFKFAAEAIVSTADCTIEFDGFTKSDLETRLKPGEVAKKNTFQALESLQYVAVSPTLKYEVHFADSHFKLSKN